MRLYKKSKKILVIGARHALMRTKMDDMSFLACHGDMTVPNLTPGGEQLTITRENSGFAYSLNGNDECAKNFDMYGIYQYFLIFFKDGGTHPISSCNDNTFLMWDKDRGCMTINGVARVYPDGRTMMISGDKESDITTRAGHKKETVSDDKASHT